jgi:hypothetical protein
MAVELIESFKLYLDRDLLGRFGGAIRDFVPGYGVTRLAGYTVARRLTCPVRSRTDRVV